MERHLGKFVGVAMGITKFEGGEDMDATGKKMKEKLGIDFDFSPKVNP